MRIKFITLFIASLTLLLGNTIAQSSTECVDENCSETNISSLTLVSDIAIQSGVQLAQIPEMNQRTIATCASGIGGPFCDFRISSPSGLEAINNLCARGELSEEECIGVSQDAEFAQVPGTCPVLVGLAKEQSSLVCGDLSRNETCYGHDQVFSDPAPVFSTPGDHAELQTIIALDSQGFEIEEAILGFGSANSHADLALGFSETLGFRYIIIGQMRIENAVAESEAIQLPQESVSVTVGETTDIINQPDTFGPSRVVGTATSDQVLLADQISEDGAWVRVYFTYNTDTSQRTTAWVPTESITPEDQTAFDALPAVEATDFTPMQSFYFSPGENALSTSALPECDNLAGSSLILQSPEGFAVTYVANNATITVDGTSIMSFDEGDDYMKVSVISGTVTVNANSPEEQVIPAGYATRIRQEDGVFNLGADNTTNDYTVQEDALWEPLFELTLSEINNFQSLESMPESLLNQAINAPMCGPDSSGNDCDITYDYTYDISLASTLCESGAIDTDLDICP